MAGLYRRLSSRMKERAREQDLVREGVLALLHDRLYSACEALIQKGSCEVTEMKNLEYLYKTYHSLGGNGTGTELFERVKNLQLK
nr:MAG TPA: minor structural protein [Caudoviricetes sp.]